MLTYPLFIDELRTLRADIDSLRNEPELARSVAFKKWNHELCMLVGTMRKSGYRSTGCYVEGRSFEFDSTWSGHDPKQLFNDELDDTMIELDTAIGLYVNCTDHARVPGKATSFHQGSFLAIYDFLELFKIAPAESTYT